MGCRENSWAVGCFRLGVPLPLPVRQAGLQACCRMLQPGCTSPLWTNSILHRISNGALDSISYTSTPSKDRSLAHGRPHQSQSSLRPSCQPAEVQRSQGGRPRVRPMLAVPLLLRGSIHRSTQGPKPISRPSPMTPRRSKATMSTGIGLRARSTNTVAQTLIRLVA